MNRSEIIIPSSGTIDMYEDAPVPITYSIADIREPDKRNSSYTKTIRIPGTANNNQLFENIFDVNTSLLTFDPNKKIYCYLLVEDETVMTGYLQLSNISVLEDNKVEYEIFLIGQVGNPFNEMGNAELTDLDFSEFDHTYDFTTQVASWANTWEQGYCYPLIDYGADNITSVFDVENLQPAIFAKQYIKKIMEGIGYTYTSSFLDGSLFQHLIIPANAQTIKYSSSEIDELLFEYNQTIASSGSITGGDFVFTTPWYDVIYDQLVNDPNLAYDSVTGEWTVISSGYYTITASGTFSYSTTGTFAGPVSHSLGIWRKPSGGSYGFIGSQTQQDLISQFVQVSIPNVGFNVGDKVKIMALTNFVNPSTGVFTSSVNGGSVFNAVVNSGLIEGNQLSLNNAVPLKIKQKEFFMSIIKMFNLYVDIDATNPKNLIIETRDDFYASGDIVDWSDKLDYSVSIESKPMGALDFKEYLWNYTDDNDYYNKLYKDKYKETYGLKRHVTTNEFQTNINETKVIFSPTPLVNDNSNDRIIPVIWAVDNSNNVSHKSFNIRILYNGGIKETAYPYNYTGRFSGDHTQTQYLYAGHLDSPQSPTLDLNFGVPREVFYDTTVYTNSNLFNRYFANQIFQLTSPDSRVVKARFRLRPMDINMLSFRDKYFFENQLFILNEIKDYNPLSDETVECVFLRLSSPTSVVINQTTINGGLVIDFEEGYPLIHNP